MKRTIELLTLVLALVLGACSNGEDNPGVGGGYANTEHSLYAVARQSVDAPIQYQAEMPLFSLDNIRSFNTETGELMLENVVFDSHLFSDIGCQYRVYFYDGDDLLFDARAVSYFSSAAYFSDLTFQCVAFGPGDTFDASETPFYIRYGYPGTLVGDEAVQELMLKNAAGMERFIEILRQTGKIMSDEPLSNENNDRIDISLTRTEQELVKGNNDFAFNLFRKVTSQKSEIVSPISITYALGMLNNGASGETQAEINKVLGFGNTGADGINDFCRKMLTEAPCLDKLTKVMIANTIYMNKGYQLKSDFVTKAKTYFDAEPETRDFFDGQTRDVINKWGNDHTEGMIPEVLKEDEFDPSAVSYLLNAIYFKGVWAEKFDKANTQDETFKTDAGEKKVVPMMHQEHEFNYTEDETCQALCLPYGNNAYRMTILLPKEGKTVNDVAQKLTAETWQRKFIWMDNAIVDVKLPRFESQSEIDLTGIMSALGMPKAFTPAADFSNFCNVPTYIGLMKQVAKIKLSEEGTEAAAVTVIGMKNTTANPSEPQRVDFHANRPFLYVISEQSTGAIFFVGKYVGD